MPTPNATFNTFVGTVSYVPLTPVSDATFNTFVGTMHYVALTPSSDATFNTFVYAQNNPPPATGTGIMLYPISEDPNQRPILRY